MASHRRPKPANRTRVSVLTATAAAAVALSAQAAHAAPQQSVKDAKAKVDALYTQAEQATEKYDAANEKLHTLEKEASSLQDQVARQQQHLNQLRDGLGAIAASQYRSGGIDPSLQLFLSSNPDSYLEQATTMDQLGSLQVGQLHQLEDAKRTLDQERAQATAKLAELQATRTDLATRKNETKDKLAQAQQVLNSLTAAQRAAIAQQDAISASRASARVDLGNAKAASGRAAAAFAAAQTRVGMPYVYGATGPSTFDCSGLTSWAYAQAGVSIPRTSQEQANAGTRIYSESQLAVGDLVIFYGDYHHVGLYAGNGMVLHAPKPGASVRYEAIGDMTFEFGVRI
ncbi:C40 family peptidase [Actinacidiphila acididurans]|uniref:C40 family peptidase n=1 Tax=Actinacidiphila acididurans TaxID=2784346 RepID=A0ABS2TU25_9ACTN|nr:NlpC/P60 family protein [Actinacidiphila acididurans]MBM9505448.1 C40 family peptidase [Actinacidiphila acididurans]